ncbi:insulinase family protein [Candidatus Sumerlaeota bacterium]|nr:insulinase family protein [Candidatus Sumerlaeota bacterium]
MSDPIPTRQRRLSNGMPLLLRENHDVAVATADVWVRTGAADEPRHISGISHFLEHMLFKGTDRFKTGEIEREIENAGGVCNAGTSYDFTHYYITLPAENIGRGIEMLGEMVRASALDAEELEKERLVILEEYRRKQDNPAAMLYEDVYEQLYETGPYHLPVIGTEETIRSISRAQMADYYSRHYGPQSAALVITGDVDEAAIAESAEKIFGGIIRPYDPLVREPEPTRIARAKKFHREKPTGGELYFALACGAPSAREIGKIIPLDLAQFILGQGRGSNLFQEIKEKRRLASSIGCYYSMQRYDSIFMVSATCEPKQREEMSGAIRGELDRFAREPIPEAQFNRAKRLLASAQLFSFETTGGASSEIGYYYTLTGGTEFMDEYQARLARVTPEEVRAAFAELSGGSDWIEVTVGPAAN